MIVEDFLCRDLQEVGFESISSALRRGENRRYGRRLMEALDRRSHQSSAAPSTVNRRHRHLIVSILFSRCVVCGLRCSFLLRCCPNCCSLQYNSRPQPQHIYIIHNRSHSFIHSSILRQIPLTVTIGCIWQLL